MVNPMVKNPLKELVIQMVFWQVLLVLSLALVLAFFVGKWMSLSALMGGLAYLLPNFLFVIWVFEKTKARDAKQFMVRFGLGEVLRLFLSAIALILFIRQFALNVPLAFVGFGVAMLGFWLISVALIWLKETKRNEY